MMSKVPGLTNTSSQEYWLKLLRLFCPLDNLNRNMLSPKGGCRQINWNNIWSLLRKTNNSVTVLFMNIYFWQLISSYANMLLNAMINGNTKLLLDHPWSQLLRESPKTVQWLWTLWEIWKIQESCWVNCWHYWM